MSCKGFLVRPYRSVRGSATEHGALQSFVAASLAGVDKEVHGTVYFQGKSLLGNCIRPEALSSVSSLAWRII